MALPSVFLVGPLEGFEGGDEPRDLKDTVSLLGSFLLQIIL